jgi:hypothetical protein
LRELLLKMLALIILCFKTAFKHIDLVMSLGLSLFQFLNLIYQRYIVSNKLLPILFELMHFIFECSHKL